MTFESDLAAFAAKVAQRRQDIFVGCTLEVTRSVVEGSELTAAPGQPVDTGNLRSSWIGDFTGAHEWQLTTNVEYAEHVENNVRGVQFKNHGPHSVALTITGWPLIVEHVTREVVGE